MRRGDSKLRTDNCGSVISATAVSMFTIQGTEVLSADRETSLESHYSLTAYGVFLRMTASSISLPASRTKTMACSVRSFAISAAPPCESYDDCTDMLA